jgi:hypothetical protein
MNLLETLEVALAGVVGEHPRDASVMVQFAAGDWAKIKEAMREERAAIAPAPTLADVAEPEGELT